MIQYYKCNKCGWEGAELHKTGSVTYADTWYICPKCGEDASECIEIKGKNARSASYSSFNRKGGKMIKIVLNESQILEMKAEIKKTEKAQKEFRPGALLFQVWPVAGVMEGKFVPNEMAVEIIKILRQK